MEMDNQMNIRVARLADAKKMLEIQQEVLAEELFLITTTEEYQQTIEGQQAWIQSKLANDHETILIAEHNDEVVGWLVFQSPNRKRLAHTCSFGMMVRKDYRGQGIGKRLIGELLTWAVANPVIEKVCLGVFSTNIGAIALYRKMGFIEEGRKIKEIKVRDNEYVDDVLMYKMV
ncbi:GNAT family N-acetyltransferase [Lysinibacillus sp. FSL W8-0992]|uniref:GNAT family N-acetyltransferase n=1 Tax=Lysinibacillus sp. FSL W8-0992 TaxID=2954643 RepID=UPI0030F93A47